MSRPLRILHTVEFYQPVVGGAQEVVRQLSRRLVALGHEVTVATTALSQRPDGLLDGVQVRGFELKGSLARGMQGGIENYRRFVREGGFDVVMNYAAQQWATDALLDILPQIPAAKVLVPCGFSGLGTALFADYFSRMPGWMKAYDECVYLAEDYRDVAFARQHGLGPGRLIPNGAGADEFEAPLTVDARQALGLKPRELFILSVGSHTGLKGHAEAAAMLRRSGLRNAALVVLGNDLGGCAKSCDRRELWSKVSPFWRMKGLRIINAEVPRATVVAAYRQADLFLLPSNIEASPLVLFEAAAAGLPFLASPAGNSAEIARWTGGGLILPARQDGEGYTRCDIAAGARLLQELGTDPQRRKQLGQAGHEAWKARYTWERITRDYEALYQELVARRERA